MRYVLCLAVLAGFLALPVQAANYRATVVNVIDGDTIRVNVPAWSKTPFTPIDVRISGIDTPETLKQFAKCDAEIVLGNAAKAYAKSLIKPGDSVTIVFKNFDKYGGRVDADVILSKKRNFSDEMIKAGYAAPYDGGTKKDWCK